MRPPSKTRSLEFQVGFFVLIGFLAIAAFSFRLTESPLFQGGIEVSTFLDDATGLFKLTKVKQAGISIGYVKEIKLENGRARIVLVIEDGYELPKNAKVVSKPMGILGDKFIEVVMPGKDSPEPPKPAPSPEPSSSDNSSSLMPHLLIALSDLVFPSAYAQTESTPAPSDKLRQGDVIQSAPSGASMDDITKKANDVATDVKETSKDIRTLVNRNKGEVENLVRTWNRMSTKLEKILNKIDADRIGQDIDDLGKAAGRMSRTLENMENITSKVDRGEGTIGKLINDPQTVQELNRTLVYLNHAIERSRRIQTVVDMNSDYHLVTNSTKTYVGLKIMTRETSGYIGQVVVDPAGTTKKVITTESKDGGTPVTTETITNDRTALKYSIQFFKRIGEVGARLGLFENSGGFGVDYFAFNDRIQASFEIFEIGREGDNPHIKTYLRAPFLTFLYAEAGADDLLTKFKTNDRRPTFFAGVGLRFTDDDIKALLLLGGIP